VLLTGIRLAVGTALLAATAWPTLKHDPFPRTVEALLFAIVALIYFGSLVGTFLLRTRRYLDWVAHGQIAAGRHRRHRVGLPDRRRGEASSPSSIRWRS